MKVLFRLCAVRKWRERREASPLYGEKRILAGNLVFRGRIGKAADASGIRHVIGGTWIPVH